MTTRSSELIAPDLREKSTPDSRYLSKLHFSAQRCCELYVSRRQRLDGCRSGARLKNGSPGSLRQVLMRSYVAKVAPWLHCIAPGKPDLRRCFVLGQRGTRNLSYIVSDRDADGGGPGMAAAVKDSTESGMTSGILLRVVYFRCVVTLSPFNLQTSRGTEFSPNKK